MQFSGLGDPGFPYMLSQVDYSPMLASLNRCTRSAVQTRSRSGPPCLVADSRPQGDIHTSAADDSPARMNEVRARPGISASISWPRWATATGRAAVGGCSRSRRTQPPLRTAQQILGRCVAENTSMAKPARTTLGQESRLLIEAKQPAAPRACQASLVGDLDLLQAAAGLMITAPRFRLSRGDLADHVPERDRKFV